MIVRFARLREEARPPTRAHEGDAGFDLYAAEGCEIAPGERANVGTGLAVAVPDGYAGLVLARSGLAHRHGIALVNAPGLIDPGYRGELRMILLNTDREHRFTVEPGHRVAQLVVIRSEATALDESPELEPTARGAAGFGSTGA